MGHDNSGLWIALAALASGIVVKVADALAPRLADAVTAPLKRLFLPPGERRKSAAETNQAESSAAVKEVEVDRAEWQLYVDRLDELEKDLQRTRTELKETRGELVAVAKWARSVVRSVHRLPTPYPDEVMSRVEEPPEIVYILR